MTKHKTERAQKVLSLMDSDEDGPHHYSKFVEQVAEEYQVPVQQVDNELEAFL